MRSNHPPPLKYVEFIVYSLLNFLRNVSALHVRCGWQVLGSIWRMLRICKQSFAWPFLQGRHAQIDVHGSRCKRSGPGLRVGVWVCCGLVGVPRGFLAYVVLSRDRTPLGPSCYPLGLGLLNCEGSWVVWLEYCSSIFRVRFGSC